MIPVNAVFDIDVAEQGVLFMVDAAHENNQFLNADVIISASQPAWMLENLLNQHPAKADRHGHLLEELLARPEALGDSPETDSTACIGSEGK
ncbi:hypothetical protein [Parazoarcus communis]|uniref:hypothetical protein n=1 Tax=Parazoarcus communis TaxID=41977 RepID=UPI001F17B9C0|nr:hypothetical protein [Parazoarcus communis]